MCRLFAGGEKGMVRSAVAPRVSANPTCTEISAGEGLR